METAAKYTIQVVSNEGIGVLYPFVLVEHSFMMNNGQKEIASRVEGRFNTLQEAVAQMGNLTGEKYVIVAESKARIEG